MRKAVLTFVMAGALVACSGEPEPVHNGSPYGVVIQKDGAEVFGTAGSALSDQELRDAVAARTVCNNARQVRNIEINRPAGGVVTFTGVCL